MMKENFSYLMGAIVGDVIGSIYEHHPQLKIDFDLYNPRCRFTDDTVLTIAVAESLVNKSSYKDSLLKWGQQYPDAGYGGRFIQWLAGDPQPYNSYGNGSAMRVSPIGFYFHSLEKVLAAAKESCMPSHNHSEGIRGAQAIAAAVYLAKNGSSKSEIVKYITEHLGYDLDFTIAEKRPFYHFDVTCQGSVPEAIVAFLDSKDYESAIRLAISLGGDSDTLACMAGSIALAYYKEIPAKLYDFVWQKLPQPITDMIWIYDKDVSSRYL